MNILKELNKEQKRAASNFDGPMLILAGAGSGKTKTVVTRTANMILNKIPGNSILVLTFTNKAAKEMKGRGIGLLEKLDIDYITPEFTTFHSWCLKFLKQYIRYSDEIYSNFTIADDNISDNILAQVIDEIYGKKKTNIKDSHLSAIFSILQNNLVSYASIEDSSNEIFNLIDKFNQENKSMNWMDDNMVDSSSFKEVALLSKCYVRYKSLLRQSNMADFDDLINLTIKILEENKELRKFVKDYYQYIMVDEFQDTNYAQIKLLNLILNKSNNICVVGDDSQSIYGWRGADIKYILNFHKEYKKTTVINLKKNYRSTANIVSRANKLLESAEEKHDLKESLQAFRKDDGKILCSQVYNDSAEAQFIAQEIRKALMKGVHPNEIAILYRSNFVVNSLEKELIKAHVPYQIFKGRSILQRKSSIELLSFINYALNKKNMVSLEMALTSTAKIISEKKMEEIKKYLAENNFELSLEEFLINPEKIKESKLRFTKPALEKLELFFNNITELRILIEGDNDIKNIANYIHGNLFLFDEYNRIKDTSKSEKTVKQAESSLNNLYFLLSLIAEYATLEQFLDDVTLSSETEDNDDEKINLMTVHASKGLEFEYVFLARFNNEVFPTKRAMAKPTLLEEERRLAYVAFTRAKVFLSISFVERGFGGIMMAPSMFLMESKIMKLKRRVNTYRY